MLVVDDETELNFAGFAAFYDPPKASAAEAISGLSAGGVSVKIVTGDNELVTEHICNQAWASDYRDVNRGRDSADGRSCPCWRG